MTTRASSVAILSVLIAAWIRPPSAEAAGDDRDEALVGHWPLAGDCRDRSGNGNHGRNHGVDLRTAHFNGRDAWIEVPHAASLDPGKGDFTVCAWVRTERHLDDAPGDVLSKFAGLGRRGFTLTLRAGGGGYSAAGNARHVHFGIDNGRPGEWEDCGRPNPTSNYVSNSLTVFDGRLYAGTTDAERFEDWSRVYRYAGGGKWEDCGRVGNGKTRGVGPLIVHDGRLYAAGWSYDWTRVSKDDLDPGRVYRYAGGRTWEDCGQPGSNRRLFGMASYKGGLYVVGEDRKCYVLEGADQWKVVGAFPNYGHPMAVHNGRLYVGVLNPGGIHCFDGSTWKDLGNPYVTQQRCNQIHAFEVFAGRLYTTTWPEGRVAELSADDKWIDRGRPGDCIEINGLTVYNGSLYCGTIPRAEVFRYDGAEKWTSLRCFLQPADYKFQNSREWSRVTSLTVFAGRMFASMGSCTSSARDAPADFRGRVYAFEAGKCVSYDRDLGAGWRHVAAVRRGDRLELFIDGKLEATSTRFTPADYDLSNSEPLAIGLGSSDHFCGNIREVRLYRRSLTEGEIAAVHRAGRELPVDR